MVTVTDEQIAAFRTDGFVRIPSVISPDEAAHFYEAALDYARRNPPRSNRPVFDQHVNVWTHDPAMRALTLHPSLAAAAKALNGTELRLWHDQILIKQPHNNAATEFHQDQPYWPHATSPKPISAWIALCDVPAEKGCMTFLPGSFRRTELPAQNLGDPRSFFDVAPDLIWSPRVTLPLKAGDCTFHHGRCAHMATPNLTDDPRVAHIVIFMEPCTTYNGKGHIVTDPLNLTVGEPIAGELFPEV
jgi:phytanoyl-CoA hydroxylase